MKTMLYGLIFLFLIITVIPANATFLPLTGSNMFITQNTQGFCIVKNQTTIVVRCGVGNATLNITHGKGMTVNMFPSNSTVWLNATGAMGPQGPQGNTGATGAQGPAGANGQVHAISQGTAISINGTTGTVQVSNAGVTSIGATAPVQASASTGSVTISCPTCSTTTTTINGASGAVTINGVAGNITSTIVGNTITVNTAWNVVTTGLSAQIITKQLTLNNLVLGGSENANSNQINSLATPTHSTDAQVSNHLGLLGSLVTGLCSNDQFLNYVTSNSTWICRTLSNSSSSAFNNINSQSAGISPTLNILFHGNASQITNSSNVLTLSLKPNVVLTNGSAQTITKQVTLNNAWLGGQMNVQANTMLVNTHTMSFPQSNSGTVCYGNQTSTCGAAPTDTDNFIASINSDTTSAQTIKGVAGNSTTNTSAGTTTINVGSNVVMTNGNNQTVTKPFILNDIYLGNSNFGYKGHIYTVPLNTGTLCLSNQTSSCGTNSGVTSITGTAGNLTASASTGAVTLNLGSNIVMIGGSSQTITKTLITNLLQLGGAENANSQQINSLATPTHSTDAQIANHLGLLGSMVVGTCSNGQFLQYQTLNSTWACRSLANGTDTDSFISSINGQIGPSITMNRGSISNMSQVVNTTNTVSYQMKPNIVLTNGSEQTFTKSLDFGQGTQQEFSSGGPVLMGADDKFATTLTNPAQTANNTLTQMIFQGTQTNALVSAFNFTSKNQTSGTTSKGVQVMLQGGITFTPKYSDNATITVSGYGQDSTLSDGCKIDVRWGTSYLGNNGATLSGTLVGQNFKLDSPSVANTPIPFSKTVEITGLTGGTKYFIDLSYSAISGGTCNIYNLDWLAQEN